MQSRAEEETILNYRNGIDLEDYGMLGILLLVRSERRLLIGGIMLGMLVAAAFFLLSPSRYEGTTTFMSASQISGDGSLGNGGSFASAASRFGLDLGGGAEDHSLLFPWILKSRELAERVLATEYADETGRRVRLVDELAMADADSTVRFGAALRKFHKTVLLHQFDSKSGVTKISITLSDRLMAASVANMVVKVLDDLFIRANTSKASEQVTFLANRTAEIERELKDSESALQAFRETNTNFRSSPRLQLEDARLQRRLDLNQQLFITLKTQWELANLERLKDVPLLVVVDPAFPPEHRASPRLGRLLVSCVGGGFVLGLILMVILNYSRLLAVEYRKVNSS
jgi:uncharacterized protein involved in exopolysaccharide biosynthesis